METSIFMRTRIYMVDDHPMIRSAVATLISSEPDMEICGEANNASTAFTDIVALKPQVAVVDLSLKGSSGFELIKRINAFNASIGIVVLSMHDECLYGLKALAAGATGYVTKGRPAQKIVEAIRSVREGRLAFETNLTNLALKRIRNGRTIENGSAVEGLSEREAEIAELIGNGHSTREIAVKLNVSIKTVETHRSHIKQKAHLQNATQLVQFCVHRSKEKPETRHACTNEALTEVA
jgi:DNA-binding NarL/FixJ family response regulator